MEKYDLPFALPDTPLAVTSQEVVDMETLRLTELVTSRTMENALQTAWEAAMKARINLMRQSDNVLVSIASRLLGDEAGKAVRNGHVGISYNHADKVVVFTWQGESKPADDTGVADSVAVNEGSTPD